MPIPASPTSSARRRRAARPGRPQRLEPVRAPDEAPAGEARQRPRQGHNLGRRHRLELTLAQQPLVQGARRGRRPGAELVEQERAQAMERVERLGDVAARRLQLHQQRVARLAVGMALDQRARRPGAVERVVGQPGAGHRLQRPRLELGQLVARRVQPRRLDARHQRPRDDPARLLTRRPRTRGIALAQPPLGLRRGGGGDLAVDLGVVEHEREPLRPAITSRPTAWRTRASTLANAAAGSAGASAGQSASISSSRETGRSRFKTR